MSRGLDKVLYHAVSSYQLLEVLLHRWLFHGEQGAALVLPDFIVEKYPQWQRLEGRGFFDQVALFPYLRIPHGEEGQVTAQALSAYDALGLPPAGGVFQSLCGGGPVLFFPVPGGQGAGLLLFRGRRRGPEPPPAGGGHFGGEVPAPTRPLPKSTACSLGRTPSSGRCSAAGRPSPPP